MKIIAMEPMFKGALNVGAFKGGIKKLPNAQYHELGKYVSSTPLKYLSSTSAAHYKAKFIDGLVEQKEPNEKMILGSLVHCLVLTPDMFESEFFIMPELNLRTNDGKALKQSLILENPNKMPITSELLDQAKAMAASCAANDQAAKLLEGTHREVSFFWQCPATQLPMRARPDAASSTHFIELKTTANASPEQFSRHLFNLSYDLSLVHYQQGIQATMGVSPPPYFIVIETEAPHVTQVYKVGESVMETGHAKWLDAVTKLERGLKKNIWPGYSELSNDIETIEVPAWAIPKSNIEMESNNDIF